MHIANILQELKRQRARIDETISALERINRRPGRPGAVERNAAPARRRRRKLTPEGRKKLSEMMKKRWAERRRKAKAAS